MRLSYRASSAILATLGLAGGLVACSSSEQATSTANSTSAAASSSEQSSSDSPLVIYSGRDESMIAPLVEKFEAATGIDTEVRYGKTAEQAQLLLTEGAATPAQVFLSQEAGALGLVGEADLLAPIPAESLGKVASQYSSASGQWVGLTGRARVVAYNSEAVSEADAPDTIEAIADPKWAGKVGIAPTNASFLSFVTAIRVEKGDDYARQWLQSLKDNGVKTYDKNTTVLEAVESGEIELGLINHYYWYKSAAELGADNMKAKLKYGAAGDLAGLVNVTGVGILKGAADNADAAAFVEFLLSEEAQSYFATKTYEYPLVEGVAAPEGVPALDPKANPDFDLSELSSVDETAALIDEVGLTS